MRNIARLMGTMLALMALMAAAPPPAPAQPLSPAQIALFETPHLANIGAAVRIDYAFRREEAGRPTVEDRITMAVDAPRPDGRHDVRPEFLTGDRHIAYPSAPGFLGNPLLMFALDRDTRELAAATGGGASWFRNRIRQALADGASVRDTTLPATGTAEPAPATEIEITPFQGEARARRYQERRYVFLLAPSIPGGIAEIRTTLPAGDGGGSVVETITFAGTRP